MALDEPVAVVAVLEGEERPAQGFDGVEALDPEELPPTRRGRRP